MTMDFSNISINALGICIQQYASECTLGNSSGNLIFESGLSVSLFLDLKDSLNFTYTVFTAQRFINTQALKDPTNPAWLLATGKVDIAISHEIYRPALVAAFDIVQPTYFSGIKAYFKQPHPSPESIFVTPFKPTVWSSFIIFWITMGAIALGTMLLYRLYLDEENPPLATLSIAMIASDTFIWIVAAIFQKSVSVRPENSAGAKLVFLTMVFISILWGAAYQGGYVSTLSVRFEPIRSFAELISNSYQFTLNNRSVSIDNYSKGLFNSYQVSAENIKKVGREHAPKLISEGRIAYLEYEDSFFGILNVVLRPIGIEPTNFFCNEVSKVLVDRMLIPSGFVLPKNSPFRQVFNIKIMHLKERGLNFRYVSIYKQETKPMCLLQNSWKVKLDLEEVALGFYIIAWGLPVCLAILLLECILWRFQYSSSLGMVPCLKIK